MKRLAIFGAGGLGRETLSWIEVSKFAEIIFVVDDKYYTTDLVAGSPVLQISNVSVEDYEWVIAIGDVQARKRIANNLGKVARFASLIHPTAIIGPRSEISQGANIGPFAVVTSDVKIGAHVHIGPRCGIGHDSVIGDFVTVSPNTTILGSCEIAQEVYLGAGALVRERVKIASGTVIGMGSVVVEDLVSGTYVGNPARLLS
jgi:acetyltransferase EpsM